MQGERLHPYLEGSQFLGNTETAKKYLILDLGSYPGMLSMKDNEEMAQEVMGELYEVSDDVRSDLDYVEGHPHLFCRQPVELSTGEMVTAYLFSENHLRELEVDQIMESVIQSANWRERNAESA